ncbi:hypothetical protein [Candidatus Bandiella euplotis]|nr:hypothetical protein [Candidatus Bandiella woodruffii]
MAKQPLKNLYGGTPGSQSGMMFDGGNAINNGSVLKGIGKKKRM